MSLGSRSPVLFNHIEEGVLYLSRGRTQCAGVPAGSKYGAEYDKLLCQRRRNANEGKSLKIAGVTFYSFQTFHI